MPSRKKSEAPASAPASATPPRRNPRIAALEQELRDTKAKLHYSEAVSSSREDQLQETCERLHKLLNAQIVPSPRQIAAAFVDTVLKIAKNEQGNLTHMSLALSDRGDIREVSLSKQHGTPQDRWTVVNAAVGHGEDSARAKPTA